jgi:hypothetical protein
MLMENPDCFEVHRRLPPLHSLMAHRSSNSHHRRIPMVPGCPKDSNGLDSPIPHPVSPRRHQLDVQRRDQVLFFITIPEIPTVSSKNLFRTVGGRSLEARVYRRRLFATNPTEIGSFEIQSQRSSFCRSAGSGQSSVDHGGIEQMGEEKVSDRRWIDLSCSG